MVSLSGGLCGQRAHKDIKGRALLQRKMSRAVPPRLFKHKLGSNGGFHVGHGCRRKRVKSTKEKTEGKVNAKEKGGSIQIPLASPKEIRIKEK